MTRQFFILSHFTLLAFCLARPAAADPVSCNDPANTGACNAIANFSVSGGANPYVYVQDQSSGMALNHYIDLSNPAQISYSCPSSSCAGISESASGSLATGVLKASGEAVNVYDDFDSVGISANDIFDLHGPAGSVSITATFEVTGTANLAAVGPGGSILIDGGDASIVLCGPGGSFACGGDTFQATGVSPFPGGTETITSEYTGKPYLLVSYTWTQATNVPFGVYYSMNLDAYSGSSIDLTDPGTLSFNLPAGYSLTSEGGYSQGVVTATPEPRTLAALLTALLAILGADIFSRRSGCKRNLS